MKFAEFQDLVIDSVCESNTIGSGDIASPDGQRMFVRRQKQFGVPCFDVDCDTYTRFMRGKKKGARWDTYLDDPEISPQLKQQYARNPKLIVRNATTGAMVYLK